MTQPVVRVWESTRPKGSHDAFESSDPEPRSVGARSSSLREQHPELPEQFVVYRPVGRRVRRHGEEVRGCCDAKLKSWWCFLCGGKVLTFGLRGWRQIL